MANILNISSTEKWININRQFLGKETHEKMLGFLTNQRCALKQQQ